MRATVFQTAAGPVARVPIFMPDRGRSLRRLRPVLGRNPVALSTGRGFTVYAARDSLAAQLHARRIARFAAPVCCTCRANPARPNQRDCLVCHGVWMRISRLDAAVAARNGGAS